MQTLTKEETQKLYKFVRDDHISEIGLCLAIRNYAMIALMLEAGLRSGEVSSMPVSCCFYNGHLLSSVSLPAEVCKNSFGRTIPMNTRLSDALIEYFDLVPRQESDFLFKVTQRQIERIVKAASKRAIGREIHPHLLRHTFATRLLQVSNLRVVQQALGHQSIRSTEVYTHPNQEDLKNGIEKM